tara:strand:- start:22 stop:1044 length:1023 start_codon:yes stop_codon:yes gene_type:complete
MVNDFEKKPVFIIAEIAQAHDGSLGILHSLIEASAKLGVDAVKFQVHIANAESTKHEPFRINFSYEDKTRFDYWKRMELSSSQWLQIKEKCNNLGVEFIATPFSSEAIDLLESLNVGKYKIGSGDLNNLLLIDRVIKTGKEVFISTGMANEDEIKFIVNRIKNSGNKLTLFQCTSKYPTNADEVNLEVINDFKQKFNCPIGLSDHSGEIYAALGAVALGADAVEVHVTFSKEMFGPDSKSSLNFDQLENLIKGIRFLEKARYGNLKTKANKDFEKLKQTFGRSLYLKRSLKKNEYISAEDLEAKKPADLGVNSSEYEKFLGKKALKNLSKGILLRIEDFL